MPDPEPLSRSTGAVRLDGLDIARGMAYVGMVLVNYGVVMAFGNRDPQWVQSMMKACTGRASALFVLLAGVGLSLMVAPATARDPGRGSDRARRTYLLRALLLLVGGYAFYPFWEGDILHFYGVYLGLGAMLVPLRSRWLVALAAAAVGGFVLIYLQWIPFWTGWRLDLSYPQFWSWTGQVRNLFYNGWHPVLPWFAFVLTGMIVGRLHLQRRRVQLLLLGGGVAIAVAANLGSDAVIEALREGDMPRHRSRPLITLLATSSLPPGPFYVAAAGGTALAVIGASLLAAGPARGLLLPLARVGRVALTLYVAHVLVGLGSWEAMGGREGRADLHEVCRWWIGTVIASLLLATLWLQFFRRGPLEAVLRRICG